MKIETKLGKTMWAIHLSEKRLKDGFKVAGTYKWRVWRKDYIHSMFATKNPRTRRVVIEYNKGSVGGSYLEHDKVLFPTRKAAEAECRKRNKEV